MLVSFKYHIDTLVSLGVVGLILVVSIGLSWVIKPKVTDKEPKS